MNVLCVFLGAPKEPDLQSTALSPVEEKSKEQRYASGQFFFEYLVVVTPKLTKEKTYEPQIIYQFPKVIQTEPCGLRVGTCAVPLESIRALGFKIIAANFFLIKVITFFSRFVDYR